MHFGGGDSVVAISLKFFRHLTVQRTLVKDIHTAFSYEETADKGQMYGLISLDLTQIKPNYDAMVKGGTLRISDDGYAQGENIRSSVCCALEVESVCRRGKMISFFGESLPFRIINGCDIRQTYTSSGTWKIPKIN